MFTNKDIKTLVEFAMAKPEYNSFGKAVFIVSQLTGTPLNTVLEIADTRVVDALIDEAYRVPLISTYDSVSGSVIEF